MRIGQRQQDVVATLKDRPAYAIRGALPKVRDAFAEFFSGSLSIGTVMQSGALKIGASIKPDWREVWNELVRRGLIEYATITKQGPNLSGVETTVYPQITRLGYQVRGDDELYQALLVRAIEEDRRIAEAKAGAG